MPSDAAPASATRRLHPWSMLFLLTAQVRQFAVPVLLALALGSRSRETAWQLYTLPLLIPYALFVVVRYRTFNYTFGDGELVIRSGLFFKNERHVPYSRIQNLDAVQNAMHRLFGVVDVRVDTGSGAAADATLSVVSWPAYEEMRRRVLEERSIGRGTDVADAEAGRAILTLGLRDLAVLGLIENRAAVLVAAVFGTLWETGMLERAVNAVGLDIARRGVLRRLFVSIFRHGTLSFDDAFGAAAAIVGLLIVLRILSVIWAIVRLYGFRLTLVGADLRTEYGLLTRVSATVPLHRIQTLTIRRGLIHRWLGRASVKVETAGGQAAGDAAGGTSARGRESLAPIVNEPDLPALLGIVLPDLSLADPVWHGPAPGAFGRELRARLVVAIIGACMSAFLLRWWAVAVLAVLAAWSWMSARTYITHLGWAVIDGAVLFRTGWIWRHLTVARFSKVQAVAMSQSPFDRRHHMASVRVDTAGAGDAAHRVDIPYLRVETAAGLFDQLGTAAARTAFRW
jgi:putative membrane protein